METLTTGQARITQSVNSCSSPGSELYQTFAFHLICPQTVLQVKWGSVLKCQRKRHPSYSCLCRGLQAGRVCSGPKLSLCDLNASTMALYIPASRRGGVALGSLRVWLYWASWATRPDDWSKGWGSWSTVSACDVTCHVQVCYLEMKWGK